MVREFTELQGTMGGIYAREEGLPEEVWKAIYFHYLPIGVEADAPPTRAQLGKAAVTWAAVSLADKLDTIVGLFAAGEKPTGSRDPYGLRRAAQGVVKILVDLPALTASHRRRSVCRADRRARLRALRRAGSRTRRWTTAVCEFLAEREAHLLERRGFSADEIRAVVPRLVDARAASDALQRVEALAQARQSPEFEALADAVQAGQEHHEGLRRRALDRRHARPTLVEPAELALLERDRCSDWPAIDAALDAGALSRRDARARRALQAASIRFFVDVLVMADDPALREARLALLADAAATRFSDIARHLGDCADETAGLKA